MGSDLRRFLAGLPVQARRHSWIGYAWRACKRKPSTAITAALLVVSVLALLVGSIVVNIRLDDRAAKIESAQNALMVQLRETDAARAREAETRVELRQHLMQSLRRDASAPRWTRRSGSRGHAYEAVRALTHRSAEVPLTPDDTQVLRNLVIAASAQIDIVPEQYAGPALPSDSQFSPNLDHYAAISRSPERLVRIHEYPSGREVVRLKVYSDVSSYSFSPDGNVFVVRDGRRSISPEPHTLVIWNWRESKIVAEIRGRFEGTPWAISPDSTELAVAHPGGAVDIHSLADGTKRRGFETKSNIYGMAYHPAGTKLATFQRQSNRIDIRDMSGGQVVRSVTTPGGPFVLALGWSADGSMLAAGCAHNHRGCVWHTENWQLACELIGHTAEVTNCMFDPNGQWLATSGWDKTTHFWHPVTGQALLDPLMGMINAISADGRRIGYHTKHDAGIWSVTQPRELLTLHGHTGGKGPWHVSFGMGGRVMATSSTDAIRLWEPTTGRAVGALRPPGGAMTALFTPDDKQLFAAGHEHCTRWPTQFDADTNRLVIGRPEALLPHQAGRTERRASLSADGARAAISNQSRGLMYVFPLDDPALWRSYGTVTELGNALLSPDGKWVIGTSWPTPSARVWNTVTNQKVMDFRVQSSVGVAFSPDGEHVVLGSVLKGEVRKVGTWEHVRDIPANSFGPAFVHATYSPDGCILAACRSSHRAVHLLDAKTFEEFARLEAPDPQPVHCIAFSPDGSRVVVNCGTRVVQVWDLRAIRERLATFGLDWDQPAYGPERVVEPLHVVIESQGK